MEKRLLCTFTDRKFIITTLRSILEYYNVLNDKIFIYDSFRPTHKTLCVYNILRDNTQREFLDNTILIHRKKDTNTLYSINALNELIMKVNNGVLDINFQIDWENYIDSLILITNSELTIDRIKFREVFLTKK